MDFMVFHLKTSKKLLLNINKKLLVKQYVGLAIIMKELTLY